MNRLILSTLAFLFAACATPPSLAGRLTPPAAIAQAQAPRTGGAVAPASRPGSVLPNEKDSVKFAVIGDTGTGGSAAYAVGKLLSDARARFPFEFVIMLGDNIYGGESPSDFVKKFERPYQPMLEGGVKFYAALGNHDSPTQRFYKPFNMEGKRYYSFSKGDAAFFVLDSTYMTPAQVDWLKDELEKSRAKWKISYFHHPLYSSGETHGSETDLRTLIEPLFMQHGVNVVFAGHEHFYERIKPQNGIYYFTEGGSAKLREGNIRASSPMTEKGFDTDNSFMLVEIAKDQLFFEAISRANQIIDSGTITRRETGSGK